MWYFDARTSMLVGAPPWALLLAMLLIALALLVIAVNKIEREDFA
jgi:hypothetical protein